MNRIQYTAFNVLIIQHMVHWNVYKPEVRYFDVDLLVYLLIYWYFDVDLLVELLYFILSIAFLSSTKLY